MSKLISIKLKSITYTGDDIGPNFHIAMRILDNETKLTERVEVGTTKTFDVAVLNQFVSENTIPVEINLIEEDPLYDESAFQQFSLPIPSQQGAQSHTLKVGVAGQGWERGRSAELAFNLEVKIDSALRDASDADGKGWLRIILEENDTETQIPYTTKVTLQNITSGREYFRIEEGHLKGIQASVRKRQDGTSFLLIGFEFKPAAKLIFKRAEKELQVEGLGTFAAETWEHDPVPEGTHDIEIPSAPHDKGQRYLSYSRYAETWLRIGHSAGRFIHCGEISAGCITVTDKAKWTEIYKFLIKSRKDDASVGTVQVVY